MLCYVMLCENMHLYVHGLQNVWFDKVQSLDQFSLNALLHRFGE